MATLTTARNSRRLLVPLATMVAAGAIAVASGATFTSSSANAASTYATGTLTQSNSRANQAIFTGSNLKPGDSISGTVTIQNTGTLPGTFSLAEAATNGFASGALNMTVTQGSTQIYSGEFSKLGTKDLGTFAAGESRTYTFTTTLASSADNTNQGKSASATYTWNSTQGAATTFTDTGVTPAKN